MFTIFNNLFKKTETNILFIGRENSGKTVLLIRLLLMHYYIRINKNFQIIKKYNQLKDLFEKN